MDRQKSFFWANHRTKCAIYTIAMINDSDIPKNVRFGKNRGGSWYTIYHHLSSFTCSRAKPEETPLFSSTNQWEFGTSQAILLSHQETAPQRLSPTRSSSRNSSERALKQRPVDSPASSWTYRLGEFIVGYVWEKSGKNIAKYFLGPFNKLTKHYDRLAHGPI